MKTIPGWSNKDNCYHSTVGVDYNDLCVFKQDTLQDIEQADNPQDYFYNLIYEKFNEYEWDEITYVCNKVEKQLEKENINYDDWELREFIQDYSLIDLPYDAFLKLKIPVNVCINAGDDNYEGACNNSVDYRYVETYSGLAYLAEKQGYSLEQLNDFINDKIDTDSVFLKSAKNAWYDATQGGHFVYICTIMTVEEWFKFKEIQKLEQPINDKYYPWNSKGKSYISITGAKKDEITWILINTGLGCVANLDGILEKDMEIPIHYISDIYLEINRGSTDTFSVQNICGVYTDWYAGEVTVHKVNNKLLKDTLNEN
jgi:hypothetical protein